MSRDDVPLVSEGVRMDSGVVMDPRVATRLEPPHRIGKNVREIEYLRYNNYKIAEKSDIRFQMYR